MNTNRKAKQLARELQRAEGIPYTEALRRVLADHLTTTVQTPEQIRNLTPAELPSIGPDVVVIQDEEEIIAGVLDDVATMLEAQRRVQGT